MDSFQGKLTKDGKAVIENVTGRYNKDFGPNRNEIWTGFFSLPQGVSLAVAEEYDMGMSDGKTSKIKIERVNQTSAGTTVSFLTVT